MRALKGKKILIGVSGGIACYKTLSLLSLLNKLGAETRVIMTRSAEEFVSPLSFQTLSKNRVYDSLFEPEDGGFIPHIDLSRQSDIFFIAPATANVIGKIANGIGDDLLTTAALASHCPLALAPAMNSHMYANPANQENLEKLRQRGVMIIEPASGRLACSAVGQGRLPEPRELAEWLDTFFTPKDLAGKKILVTGGGSRERIDPVRFLSNDSSGKQGLALAVQAQKRGADVLFIHGHVEVPIPSTLPSLAVESARDMLEALQEHFGQADALVMAAAPSDYRPAKTYDQKIKKSAGGLSSLALEENPDILKSLAKDKREGQILIGFAAETEDLIPHARKKLEEKGADYMVANAVGGKESAFNSDSNTITILSKEGQESYPRMSKEEAADRILDLIHG